MNQTGGFIGMSIKTEGPPINHAGVYQSRAPIHVNFDPRTGLSGDSPKGMMPSGPLIWNPPEGPKQKRKMVFQDSVKFHVSGWEGIYSSVFLLLLFSQQLKALGSQPR